MQNEDGVLIVEKSFYPALSLILRSDSTRRRQLAIEVATLAKVRCLETLKDVPGCFRCVVERVDPSQRSSQRFLAEMLYDVNTYQLLELTFLRTAAADPS